MNHAVIIGAKRTPVGSFGGNLSHMTAPELGASAVLEVIRSVGIRHGDIQELVFGNVLSAGIGQAPARQVAIKAGLSSSTPCTTVNKVCASGMKAVMIAADQIRLGTNDTMIAGGMESMSNVPYYLPQHRFGSKLGAGIVQDGILKDGLWDVYKNFHMGSAAEICAEQYKISREEQDQYAISSYKRLIEAHEKGYLKDEIVKIKSQKSRGNITEITTDEEIQKVDFDKIPSLRPVFEKKGTVTAANASSINDGAAAVLVMNEKKAAEMKLDPVARIRSYGSTAKASEWFTTAPADVIPLVLKQADLKIGDIDLFEINEAFSVVSLVNNRLLDLDPGKVNIHGGAVSIGHPIGCSGARIIVALVHALKRTGGKFGCAAVCNGGGGASALVLEMI